MNTRTIIVPTLPAVTSSIPSKPNPITVTRAPWEPEDAPETVTKDQTPTWPRWRYA